MGTIYNFNKMKFKPYRLRFDNLCVTNYYVDYLGKKKTLQPNLDLPKYSFFEILKYQKNDLFGKIDEFEETVPGSGLYRSKEKGVYSALIDKSSFLKEETCYMLARWENINHDELIPDLLFVGSRPLNLPLHEQKTFMDLARAGQLEIEKQLRKNTNVQDH